MMLIALIVQILQIAAKVVIKVQLMRLKVIIPILLLIIRLPLTSLMQRKVTKQIQLINNHLIQM